MVSLRSLFLAKHQILFHLENYCKFVTSVFPVGGHDSKEDAASCIELMMWKLKEDAKKAARR